MKKKMLIALISSCCILGLISNSALAATCPPSCKLERTATGYRCTGAKPTTCKKEKGPCCMIQCEGTYDSKGNAKTCS